MRRQCSGNFSATCFELYCSQKIRWTSLSLAWWCSVFDITCTISSARSSLSPARKVPGSLRCSNTSSSCQPAGTSTGTPAETASQNFNGLIPYWSLRRSWIGMTMTSQALLKTVTCSNGRGARNEIHLLSFNLSTISSNFWRHWPSPTKTNCTARSEFSRTCSADWMSRSKPCQGENVPANPTM